MEERFYWLGWAVFPGVGPGKFKLLLNHFKSAKEAWGTSSQDLKDVIGEKLSGDFEEFRKTFSIENYLKKLTQKEVWFLTQKDKEYPQLLLQINKPPIVLFGKGKSHDISGSCQSFSSRQCSSKSHPAFAGVERLRAVGNPSNSATPKSKSSFEIHDQPPIAFNTIAVVGTRKVTSYGKEVTEILTGDLVRAGFVIISGLAMGVDAVAHKTAIENGGKTIAVLGCGVDLCYPSSNKKLYDEIINGNGAVISEFPIGMTPSVGSFPSRNRIIAGLSSGVLVTEGAEDSGSLITADYALKYGRKVFAVPGPITSSLAKGPNSLISKGAKLVTSASDILNEFQISNFKYQINTNDGTDSRQDKLVPKFKNLTKEERKILEILENEPLHFDEITRRTKFDSAKLGSILSLMEIKGFVKQTLSGTYSLAMV